MTLNAFEVVELRLLEHGRGSMSDGHHWLRVTLASVVAVVFTACLASIAEQGSWSSVQFVMACLPMTLSICGLGAWWSHAAGEVASQRRVEHLRSSLR